MKGNEKTDVKNLGCEKKKKMNVKVLFAAAAAFIVLLSFGGIAYADPYCGGLPLTSVREGEVSGDLWFDDSCPLVTDWTKSYTLPSYTDVEWAQLYVAIYCAHMQNCYPGTANITFNGVQLGGTPSSELLDGCYTYPALLYETPCANGTTGYMGAGPDYGRGSEWVNDHCVRVTSDYLMWYDVTNLVQPNSNVAIETSKIYPNFDGRIKLVTLVVAYNDGDTDTVHYWVNRGHDVDNYYWDNEGKPNYIGETNFSAGLPEGTTVHSSNLTLVHMASQDGKYTFNGVSIPTDPTGDDGVNWQGGYSGYDTWYVSSLFNSNSDNTLTYDRDGPYYKIGLAFLTANYTEEAVEEPDLVVTEINAYHNDTTTPAWFNLSNEIDVTVRNNGTAPAGASNVSLYIEGVFFGKLPVSSLSAGANETVTFENWKPIGDDCQQPSCQFNGSYNDYNITSIADCDGDVAESNETNNETKVVERACYNGYMTDEPLENVAHGLIHGHLNFTTGDGVYTGLYSVGDSKDTQYDITIPAGASVEYANLNVYYTWYYEKASCPQMEVSITNATGTYILPREKTYNDIKCYCPGASWVFPWGNYVYDLKDYIQGSCTYTVTVKRTGGQSFCISAPGIVLVYEDENAPLIEYWVNNGADILIGGRRGDGGFLSLEECINNATFPASTTTYEVVTATLGVVSPWAGSSWEPGQTNYLFFNDVELGTGVYHGYGETYYNAIDSMTMEICSANAQVGVNVTDVTAHYLQGSENVVGQGDDGDNMMPANAFLVVAY